MERFCYIGIDGGGTSTVAVALNQDGSVLARAKADSVNYYSVGRECAVRTLRALVCELTEAAGAPAAALCLGSSALDERIRDEHYRAFLADCRADEVLGSIPLFDVRSDAAIALFALTGAGARGAILIAGTGVMGLASKTGEDLHTVAGWGDVLGDPGSGYDIALRGIRRALDYADGKATDGRALYEACLSFYGLSEIAELIPLVYGEGFDKSRIAAFGTKVAELAENTDPASSTILLEATEQLCAHARALCEYLGDAPFPFGVYGSVLTKNLGIRAAFFRYLQEAFPQAVIQSPTHSAELAAAQYILRRSLV